jgi:hypothetical protein
MTYHSAEEFYELLRQNESIEDFINWLHLISIKYYGAEIDLPIWMEMNKINRWFHFTLVIHFNVIKIVNVEEITREEYVDHITSREIEDSVSEMKKMINP